MNIFDNSRIFFEEKKNYAHSVTFSIESPHHNLLIRLLIFKIIIFN